MSRPREPEWWPATISGTGCGGNPPVMVGTPDGAPPGVDVWHIRLDVDDDAARAGAALLDQDERRRADRICDGLAAHRYIVAHGAARTILARYLGVAGHAVRWTTGARGKPAFGGSDSRWQWSLSRSGGHSLLAVCQTTPIGVDLERVRDDIPETALASRFLPAQEAASVCAHDDAASRRAAYHRLLSRKEACVKASGGGFLDGLRLTVLVPGAVRGAGALAGQRWTLRDLRVPPSFVGAIAAVGDEIGEIRCLEWDRRFGPARQVAALLPGQPPWGRRARQYRC